MSDDRSTTSAITRLETQMENVSTGVNELKETMKEGFANLHTHVDSEMAHMKANIMTVVNTKANESTTKLRLDSLEAELVKKVDAQRIDDLKKAADDRAQDMRMQLATKTDGKEFTFIKSIVLGACALILVGFMGAVTAIVYEAKAGKFDNPPAATATVVTK